MVGQFGVLIVVGRDAVVNLNFGERYDWGGSSSIVCNHELALTPSIRCSRYFGQDARRRRGDVSVSIAEHRRSARSYVASTAWGLSHFTDVLVVLVVCH